MVGAPRQMVPFDAANRLEDLHRLGDHFFADTVARDHRDSMCHQRILAAERSTLVASALLRRESHYGGRTALRGRVQAAGASSVSWHAPQSLLARVRRSVSA